MSRDTLEFAGVHESDAAVTVQTACEVLDQLELEYEYDEVSPPDENNRVNIRIVGVRPKD